MNRRTFLKLSALTLLSISCRSVFPRKEVIPTKNPRKVIIIGAGMAGAGAASHLKEMGHEVLVLEARNRIGGRIFTDRSGGYPIDLGAAWIHGSLGNPLIELAERYSVKTKETDFENIMLVYESKKISKLDLYSAHKKFESILKKIEYFTEDNPSVTSLKSYLEKEYSRLNLPPLDRKVFEFLERGLENENASTLSETSAYAFFHTTENYEGEDELVYGGYDSILKGLLRDVPVLLDEQVLHIRNQNSEISVETSKGLHRGDFVIVTVPVSVLQKKSIQFTPSLPPEKVRSINAIPMGIFNKYILEFEDKFWSDEEVFADLTQPKPMYDLIFNFHSYLKVPVLGFMGTGERSDRFGMDPDMKSLALSELKNIFQKKIPEPRRILSTQWGRDEFALGSYSYAVNHMKSYIREYSRPLGNIHFAGEATHEKYFSYVHGAYLSGIREAELIASKTNSSSP